MDDLKPAESASEQFSEEGEEEEYVPIPVPVPAARTAAAAAATAAAAAAATAAAAAATAAAAPDENVASRNLKRTAAAAGLRAVLSAPGASGGGGGSSPYSPRAPPPNPAVGLSAYTHAPVLYTTLENAVAGSAIELGTDEATVERRVTQAIHKVRAIVAQCEQAEQQA